MRAYVIDQLWESVVSADLLDRCRDAGIELVVAGDGLALGDFRELYEGDADRILCVNPDNVGWKLPAEAYRDIPHLKGIFLSVTAFSWVDVSYANEHDIPVCNLRSYSTEAVAEWAVLTMVALARQVPMLIKAEFPLDYRADFLTYRGRQLEGRTAGIIGLGSIGAAIAQRCAGLGMDVVYWSRSPKESPHRRADLDDVLAEADVIFLALAHNDETAQLLTNDRLDLMKPDALFVNITHAMYDEQKLVDMVRTGSLAGYGFEAAPGAFSEYPGNIWAAPQYAWATEEAMWNAMTQLVDGMVLASEGRFPNRVNPPRPSS